MLTQTKAARDVLIERDRQVECEGCTLEHDDTHDQGELATAAASLALASSFKKTDLYNKLHPPQMWPWSLGWWKPKSRREDLVRAGALIIAEIERLDRKASGEKP